MQAGKHTLCSVQGWGHNACQWVSRPHTTPPRCSPGVGCRSHNKASLCQTRQCRSQTVAEIHHIKNTITGTLLSEYKSHITSPISLFFDYLHVLGTDYYSEVSVCAVNKSHYEYTVTNPFEENVTAMKFHPF